MAHIQHLLLIGAMALALFSGAPIFIEAEAAEIDMTGTWNLEVESPSGSGAPTFVLKQDGQALSGTYSGAFGESPVQGKVNGNSFELSFDTAGITITYTGNVEGRQMKGDVKFATYGSGTFTGEKQ